MTGGHFYHLSVLQGQQGCLFWSLLFIGPSLSSPAWGLQPCSCSSVLFFSAHICWKDTAQLWDAELKGGQSVKVWKALVQLPSCRSGCPSSPRLS